jgi:hypothetical protein
MDQKRSLNQRGCCVEFVLAGNNGENTRARLGSSDRPEIIGLPSSAYRKIATGLRCSRADRIWTGDDRNQGLEPL